MTPAAPTHISLKKQLHLLPGFIGYILEQRLETFIDLQWQLSEEVEAPIMKYFSAIPPEDRLKVSLEPTIEYWSYIVRGEMDAQIEDALQKWVNNQLPIIGRDQLVAEDITKAQYIRRTALLRLLPDYTQDFGIYTEISGEIDYYLQEVTSRSFKVFIDIQNERLRKGNQFAEALINSSTDLILALDKDLRLITMNNKALDRYHMVLSDVIGRTVEELFPQIKGTSIQADLCRVLTGETVRYHSTRSLINGEDLFDMHLLPLSDGEGGTYGVLCVSHLVTDTAKVNLKISELNYDLQEKSEMLRRNEEQYQKMIAEVQDYAIILLDTDGTIRNWNMGASKIKGYTAEEIVGKNFRLFYSEQDRKNQLPEQLLGLAQKNGRATHEGWRVRKDGSRFWGSVVITALHDTDGRVVGFSKVTRDLSERKIAEEQLKAKNKQLEANNEMLKAKNKELRAFNHVASHDLQEPLRKIRTFANMILDPEAQTTEERKKELLQRIITSSKNMQQFIDDLLIYSKAHDVSSQYEDVDLNKIVERVKEEAINPDESGQITISIPHLPHIHAVSVQMYQLFQNLIGNSIKYAQPGQPVKIDINYSQVPGSAIVHGHPDTGAYYHLITVTDNGIGFEQEYAEKIFEPFQRLHAKSQYFGSGVGLAICKTIVKNHAGIIYATGEPEKGATFYVALPVS
ncbi:MAG: PAS domain S-box protein [Bacteroidetes bacterium]|nr:PAS domain S-box protein [Bacteroidota bacterium]